MISSGKQQKGFSLSLLFFLFIVLLPSVADAQIARLITTDMKVDREWVQAGNPAVSDNGKVLRIQGRSELVHEMPGVKSDPLGVFTLALFVSRTPAGKYHVFEELAFRFPPERWPVTSGGERVYTKFSFEVSPEELGQVERLGGADFVSGVSEGLGNKLIAKIELYEKEGAGRLGPALAQVTLQFVGASLKATCEWVPEIVRNYDDLAEKEAA